MQFRNPPNEPNRNNLHRCRERERTERRIRVQRFRDTHAALTGLVCSSPNRGQPPPPPDQLCADSSAKIVMGHDVPKRVSKLVPSSSALNLLLRLDYQLG